MQDLLAEFGPWLAIGMGVGGMVVLLVGAVLLYPHSKLRMLAVSRILPYSRQHVWQAYFAAMTFLTGGLSHTTLEVDDEFTFESTVGPRDEVTAVMQVRVMRFEPERLYVAHPLTFDGVPFPGGSLSCDGIMLDDAPGGTVTTIFLHVETPNLLHAWFMRLAISRAFAKLERRLKAIPPPAVGSSLVSA
ncbi:MAG: hypothetical protein ACKVP7_15630 [Hyphomicrobiaceae bacterium]